MYVMNIWKRLNKGVVSSHCWTTIWYLSKEALVGGPYMVYKMVPNKISNSLSYWMRCEYRAMIFILRSRWQIIFWHPSSLTLIWQALSRNCASEPDTGYSKYMRAYTSTSTLANFGISCVLSYEHYIMKDWWAETCTLCVMVRDLFAVPVTIVFIESIGLTTLNITGTLISSIV